MISVCCAVCVLGFRCAVLSMCCTVCVVAVCVLCCLYAVLLVFCAVCMTMLVHCNITDLFNINRWSSYTESTVVVCVMMLVELKLG